MATRVFEPKEENPYQRDNDRKTIRTPIHAGSTFTPIQSIAASRTPLVTGQLGFRTGFVFPARESNYRILTNYETHR